MTAVLTIKDFSCIDKAELRLSQLTVLIGPQASGKSVISKLVYFFYDIFGRQFRWADEEEEIEDFREAVESEFKKWFPPSAWGGKKFEISFRAGVYFVKVTRMGAKKNGSENEGIRIDFSPWFEEQYNAMLKAIQDRKNKKRDRKVRELEFDDSWRVVAAARKIVDDKLKGDAVSWQLFVPAGRSFFTSVGKAIAAFEYSGMLDPLTLQFGRFFASVRENRHGRFAFPRRPTEEQQRVRNEMMRKLFGGNITFSKQQEFLVSDDGRKIPFSAMSSGQQELLPLWLSIEYAQDGAPNSLVYIEEPEAHLFPTAQSQVVEFLASVISDANSRMLITTHSPYVLTQINILLKAGELAERFPKARTEIEKVVKEQNWLKPASTVAYAIAGRRLIQITDEDGLLKGDYLDEVSGYLEREFSSLLEIEITNDH